jgi:hypothetical protein
MGFGKRELNNLAFWIITIVFLIVIGYLFITGRAFE